jgi:hypothetical protein
MAGEGYQVPATMTSLANGLDDAAEVVRDARRTAGGVRLDAGGYGPLLWWLPLALSLLQDTVIAGLGECERGIRDNLADGVRLADQAYTDVDLAGARSLAEIRLG